MASMTSSTATAQPAGVLFGGIDTHKDIHVAALLDCDGGLVGSASFPTTRAGYRQLLGWMHTFGILARVGVEGTGSYGAGLSPADRGRCGGGGGEPAGPQPAPTPRQIRRLGCRRCRRSGPYRQPHRHPEI